MRNYPSRESALDHAIDRAVHEMAQVDPRPGLSRRVLRRLESGATAQHTRWTLPRWQGALAAVTALLIVTVALFTLRSPDAQPVPSTQVATNPPAAPAPSAPEPRAVAPSPTRTAPVARQRERSPESIFGPRHDRVAAASVPTAVPATIPAPAYEPAEPHAATPVDPITIAPIGVSPIEIRRITIPSLTPSQRGDR